jgi:hypothetical protein
MGIVAVMELTSRLYDQPNSKPDDRTDGSTPWWRYHADAVIQDADGFVSPADLNIILGYSVDNRPSGFGDDHSRRQTHRKANIR